MRGSTDSHGPGYYIKHGGENVGATLNNFRDTARLVLPPITTIRVRELIALVLVFAELRTLCFFFYQ